MIHEGAVVVALSVGAGGAEDAGLLLQLRPGGPGRAGAGGSKWPPWPAAASGSGQRPGRAPRRRLGDGRWAGPGGARRGLIGCLPPPAGGAGGAGRQGGSHGYK